MEFVGITVLFLDEKVNSVIHGFTPVGRANHYMPSLKAVKIRLFDNLQVIANTNLELPDVVGHIRYVQGSGLTKETTRVSEHSLWLPRFGDSLNFKKDREFVGITVLFLDDKIGDLNIAKKEEDIGFYAGFVGCSFMVGRTLTSVIWGIVADRYGRKPVILIGIASVVIFNTLFGLSVNFLMAIITRFCLGSFNGLLVPIKSEHSLWLPRFWDSLNFKKDREFVGITVLFLDEKVNSVIHGFTPVGRANHYMPSLKAGSIVKVDRFEVSRCSSMYKITDHPFLIRFISLTIIDEVITGAPEINIQSRLDCSTISK
ncbi:hypothetical protein F2Q69_00023862 [Brassica cretica]|uniref:Major facilitator superfamily (MFS) profile domain-containing protein n=1 Tax=Brassica cretica TaxID=69181 RepID=A0A8S9QMP9_BRACR|nr:hypothetical protein F2Q69_00023862 [Brassica cretica]